MIGSFKIFWEKKFIFSCVIWSCTYFHRWTLKISLFNTLKAWRLYPLDDIVKSLAAEYWHKLCDMISSNIDAFGCCATQSMHVDLIIV